MNESVTRGCATCVAVTRDRPSCGSWSWTTASSSLTPPSNISCKWSLSRRTRGKIVSHSVTFRDVPCPSFSHTALVLRYHWYLTNSFTVYCMFSNRALSVAQKDRILCDFVEFRYSLLVVRVKLKALCSIHVASLAIER